jgi:phage terminase large subunit
MSIQAQSAPLTIELKYQPMPKQGEFHGLNAKHRFFGGGFGNGKTSAGCAEAFFLAMEYPGCTGLICRKTLPEIKATTLKTFLHGGGGDPSCDWTGVPEELIRRHNKSDKIIELINGSTIHYWPLDDPDKLTNINLGWFLIDQAEEVPEEMFMMLIGRLRERIGPRKSLVLFNPNGHDWIWRRLVFLKDSYRDHALVHAKTSDNFNLPSDYIEQFKDYPESWRKRFFDGSFDVFTGQIWPEYDPELHEINPVPLEKWWEIAEGIDHGRRNPTSILWAAFFSRFGKNYCFVIDEHYKKGQLVSHHANALLENRKQLGGIRPLWTVIDASAAQQDPNTGRSVMDEYFAHGIPVVPSDRHKIARIVRVAEWLTPKEDVPHPLTGEHREGGWPQLFIFNNCINLKEHVPQYRWKPQPPNQMEDAKEEALKKDDHDVDALGYILMMRPKPGEKPINADPDQDPRSHQYWQRQKKKSHESRKRRSRTGVD